MKTLILSITTSRLCYY